MRVLILRLAASLAVSVLAACQNEPAALTDAQKAALADSAKTIVRNMVANANKLDFDSYFKDYSGDADTRYVENGALIPSLAAFKKQYADMAPILDSLTNMVDVIDAIVLGPDAVAITMPDPFIVKAKGRAAVKAHGVWTAIVQRRSGKLQIVQTHESWVNPESVMAALVGPPAKAAVAKK
jgi:hypothetical protein